MSVIECIPNISEGRRSDVLDACAAAVRATGVHLLDVNRSDIAAVTRDYGGDRGERARAVSERNTEPDQVAHLATVARGFHRQIGPS